MRLVEDQLEREGLLRNLLDLCALGWGLQDHRMGLEGE